MDFRNSHFYLNKADRTHSQPLLIKKFNMKYLLEDTRA